MRIFFDTEFLVLSPSHIELVSLGAVREDGKAFYAENAECDLTKANPWVQTHVVPRLTGPAWPLELIAGGFFDFIQADTPHPRPEFWAYYCTYDFWLLTQLFGGWDGFPDIWPKYCNELKTLMKLKGRHNPPKQTSVEHHALNDAIWNRDVYDYCMETETT